MPENAKKVSLKCSTRSKVVLNGDPNEILVAVGEAKSNLNESLE